MKDNKNTDQNVNLEDNNQNQNNEPEVNESDEDANNNSGSNNDSNSEKTFTQSQVSSMMAKEKKQGRNSAYNELGIDSEDEELMKTVKEFVEFKKSSKAKEDEPNSNSNSNSELEQKLALAEAKIEALALGVKSQYVDDIITLVASRIGGESDLKTVLAEYKLKYPAWFGLANDGTEDEDANNPDKNGTGSTLRTKTKKSDPENSIGSRLAAQRVSRQKNSNFWGK